MAMGAFLAGVLLSESSFRHQLKADVEPFRGLLLGLFFLAVGMSLDLAVVARNWGLVLGSVLALMLTKAICVYVVARITHSSHTDALDRAALMAQGGEFAFVLFAQALAQKVIAPEMNAKLTAIVVLSMAFTPLVVLAHRLIARPAAPSLDGIDTPHDGLHGSVLVVGFGRVGQIVTQSAMLRGSDITIIDRETRTIVTAQGYGFKVYYGDGARPEALHAAGAQHASAIVVCIDDKAAATLIAQTAKTHFPQAKLIMRAFDREHATALVKTKADVMVCKTFESALRLGHATLMALGASTEDAEEHIAELRRLDAERFAIESVGGSFAGRDLMLGRKTSADNLALKRASLITDTAHASGWGQNS